MKKSSKYLFKGADRIIMPELTRRFLFITALLLIAATAVLFVVLFPLIVNEEGRGVTLVTISLIVIISVVASVVSVLFYKMLSRKK